MGRRSSDRIEAQREALSDGARDPESERASDGHDFRAGAAGSRSAAGGSDAAGGSAVGSGAGSSESDSSESDSSGGRNRRSVDGETSTTHDGSSASPPQQAQSPPSQPQQTSAPQRQQGGDASPQPPLARSYAATVVLVLLALTPNIIVTTAVSLLEPQIASALGASRTILELSPAMSNAGYAFGAVLAADLYARFNPRRLFMFCEAAFVIGALCSTVAPNAPVFIAGRILQGLSTGWMLVVAVPPLVNRFPPSRMPTTAVTFLVGFFGAATAGPLVGGVVAAASIWRWFFLALALIGAANIGLVVLTVPSQKPQQPDLPLDLPAVVLSAAATVMSFYGIYLIGTAVPATPIGWGLVGLGSLSLIALLVIEYRAENPLVPVKPLSTSLPVLGVICAMISGAVFVALLELIETVLQQGRHLAPLAVGLLFWPEVLGIVVAGLIFWRLFTTRFIPVLALGGMIALAVAALLVANVAIAPRGVGAVAILAIAALLGVGAGLTVSPSLMLAAFGVPSKQIGRTFALVELLRSSAAYLLGPVFVAFVRSAATASVAAGGGASGTAGATGAAGAAAARHVDLSAMLTGVHVGAWISFGFMGAAIVGSVLMFVLTGLKLRAPDLVGWIKEGKQALDSPPVSTATDGG